MVDIDSVSNDTNSIHIKINADSVKEYVFITYVYIQFLINYYHLWIYKLVKKKKTSIFWFSFELVHIPVLLSCTCILSLK